MNKKYLISVAIVIALVWIIYSSITAKRIHPPKEEWMKEHAAVVERNKNPQEFCLDCHQKKFGHTKENFCNECHQASNVKLVE